MKKEIASTQVEKECSLRKLSEEELSEVSGGGLGSAMLAGALLLPSVFVNAGIAKPLDSTEKVTSGINYTYGGEKTDTIWITSCEPEVYLDRHFPAMTHKRGLRGFEICRDSHVTVDPRNPGYIDSGQGFVMSNFPGLVRSIIGRCPKKLNLPNAGLGLDGENCIDKVDEITVEPENKYYGKLPGTKTGLYSKFITTYKACDLDVVQAFMNKKEFENLKELRLTKEMLNELDIRNFVYKADTVIFEDPQGNAVCTPESFHIPKHLTPDYPGIWECITRTKKATVDPANKHFRQFGPYVMSAGNFYEGVIKVCPFIPEGNDWLLHIPADAPKGLDDCIKKSHKVIIDPVKFGQNYGQAGGLIWKYNKDGRAELLHVDPDEVKLTEDTPYLRNLDEILKKTKKVTVEPGCPYYIGYKGFVAHRSIKPSLKVLDSIPTDEKGLRRFTEIKVDQKSAITNPLLVGFHENPAGVAERFCKQKPFSYDENRPEPKNISKKTLLDAKAAVLFALDLANPEVCGSSLVCKNGMCSDDDLAQELDKITDTAEKERFIDKKLAMFKEKVSDYDRAKAVYNWVTENIAYNLAEVGDENHEGPEQCESQFLNHASQVLDRKMGVCRGYAHLTNLLMRVAGIPSAYVSGEGHAINAIFINGDWYLIDSTHDSKQIVNRHLYKVKRKNLPENYKEDPRYNNKEVPHSSKRPTEDHFPSKDKSAAEHNIDFITYEYGTNDWSGDFAWERYESLHDVKTVSVEGEQKALKEKFLGFLGF